MCSCGDLWIFNGAVACTVYYELQKEVYRPGRHMHTTGQTILILTQPFFFNKLFGNAVESNEQANASDGSGIKKIFYSFPKKAEFPHF